MGHVYLSSEIRERETVQMSMSISIANYVPEPYHSLLQSSLHFWIRQGRGKCGTYANLRHPTVGLLW